MASESGDLRVAEADVVFAERFLEMLYNKGIEYLFINAGTDAAPFTEAYARQVHSGLNFPRPITGAHENLVVTMSHGYTMVTGDMQAVMVHVSVGAANAACGVMSAKRDEIPILFMAGRTPLYEHTLRGSRNGANHWGQEMFDQAGMLREFVKWDYELRGPANAEDVIDRAIAIARAEPQGPVYLTLPREVLATEETIAAGHRAVAIPSPAAPSPASVEALARLIEAARCPVLVTSASGRKPETVAPLAAFCERFGIGIVEAQSRYVCAPADHPYHLGQSLTPYLNDVDLMICLECEVPYLPWAGELPESVPIVHVAPDPMFSAYPLRSFVGDLAVTSSASELFAPLSDALDRITTEASIAARQASAAALAARRAETIRARLAPLIEKPRMIKDWLNHCMNEALPQNAIVVNEYWCNRDIFNAQEAGSYFLHSTAAALGWGVPAAIGAALAAPDRPVVCTVGDGSYIFANPAACHHAAAMHNTPFMTLICNNARWQAVESSTIIVYPDGYAAKGPKPAPLSDLSPIPDFERYVEAVGGYGERVSDPTQLVNAIRRGLKIMKEERRQVLLNVILQV